MRALASRLAEGSARLVVAGLEYRLRRRTRVALLALDDRMLADIGLRRCRAARGQAHRYDLLP